MFHRLTALLALFALLAAFGLSHADSAKDYGLSSGTVELKSSGPLGFGPNGILFVGDPVAATIYAIDTKDTKPSESKEKPNVQGIDEKVASLLGTEANNIQVKDLAVNPISGASYLSVVRGKGPTDPAVLVRVARDGKLSELSLKNVQHSRAAIPNPPDAKGKAKAKGGPSSRLDAITHLAYVNGRVLVAGLSNEEFASKLRSIPFPFDKTDRGTSIEIFHGAHGRVETQSPIRVFAPYKIAGEDHLLAAYTCTPLVKMPLSSLQPEKKVVGTTVAELGNRNRPLSMVVYNKEGKDYVLLANSSRGLMKINLEGVDTAKGIRARISDKAGLGYVTIKEKSGVEKLDALDKENVVILIREGKGKLNLETMQLP